jgi:hypothetical protein
MEYLSAFILGQTKLRDRALTPICVKYRNKQVFEFSLDTQQVKLKTYFREVATSWKAGVRLPVGYIFLLATASRPALGLTQPPVQWVPATISSGVKRPRSRIYPPTPSYILMAWCLIKHSSIIDMDTGYPD